MNSLKEDKELTIPTVKIGEKEIPKVILGNLPFLGISYQGKEMDKQYFERFSNIENTIKILQTAVKFGITVVGANPKDGGELAEKFLSAVIEASNRSHIKLAVVPCISIPLKVDSEPIDDYRRWATHYKFEKAIAGERILERYLLDPILKYRPNWNTNLKNATPYTSEEIENVEIDFNQISKRLKSFEKHQVLYVEIGSECDFLAASRRIDLLKDLITFLRKKYDLIVLGTHHAGATIPIVENEGLNIDAYLTPINHLGVMMFPTIEHVKKAIFNTEKTIIAMKTLAGGRINPKDAFKFVFHEIKADSCMIGVGSEQELKENMSCLKKYM